MADHIDIIEINQTLATYEIVVEIDEPKVKQLVAFELASAPVVDAVAPTITFLDPLPGGQITRNRALIFEMEDDAALGVEAVLVRFDATGDYEVAWDGSGFAQRYSGSTRTPIVGGARYELRRTGGWPTTPTVRGIAVDTAGNEAA